MGNPTRFLGGIATVSRSDVMGKYPFPDPTAWATYFEDFLDYIPAKFKIITTGSGHSVSTQGLGGIGSFTNGTADGNIQTYSPLDTTVNAAAAVWPVLVSGVGAVDPIIFKTRLGVTDSIAGAANTQNRWYIGLHQGENSNPFNAVRQFWFEKADNAVGTVEFVQLTPSGSLRTVVGTMAGTSTAIATATLGFYWNGKTEAAGGKIQLYFNGRMVATVPARYLSSAQKYTIGWGQQNGQASASLMHIDYIFAAQYRGN
jgi:archaellum component FlaF (FlaF/FlaG flagellin family)